MRRAQASASSCRSISRGSVELMSRVRGLKSTQPERMREIFEALSLLIVHLSLPEPRHSTMTNEQSTMNNVLLITPQKFSARLLRTPDHRPLRFGGRYAN